MACKELQEVLSKCKLDEHYNYLFTKGFNTWDALQLLDTSDFDQLSAIPYGHLKLIIQTVQKYSKEHNLSMMDQKIRPKYKQFLKSLNKIPKPDNLFINIDKQINKYQEIKQKYLENWTKQQQYKTKIDNFLKITSHSDINAPVTTQEVRSFLVEMQKLNGSLQQLLQYMGNPNIDINTKLNSNTSDEYKTNISPLNPINPTPTNPIIKNKNISPSSARKLSNNIDIKHKKKKSNALRNKNKRATPTHWTVDEESSLIQDVKLYSKINLLKIKKYTKEDWKTIAIQHNDNFWKNTQFKGRTYKECKERYKKAPITGIDTKGNDHIDGEIDEPDDDSSDNDNGIVIQPVPPTVNNNNNNNNGNISSSDDDDDDLGLLGQMLAPGQ